MQTKQSALDEFLSLCAQPDWARLQLTQAPTREGAQRLQLRPLTLRGAPHWQAVWRHATKDLTENWPASEGLARLRTLLEGGWRSAALWTPQGHWQLDQRRRGDWRLVRHRDGVEPVSSSAHNREKVRALDLAHPVWRALGLADERGRLVPAMARKWKQINRFVEIFDAGLRQAALPGDRPLRVADFGCGRGYLTFAIALHLAAQGRAAEVLGLELRSDLVAQTESLAREHGVAGLHFAEGDVGHAEVRPLDVMIALHACDTATDHALHHALRSGAQLVLSAPCCHKELRGQLQPPSALKPLFRHGIHLGQEAEMITDGLRALLLEREGYDTQVFEFISLEHTQKNKMIQAVRRPGADGSRRARAQAELQGLKDFWQWREQALERLLGAG